jgi:hypothetical protein
MPAISTPTVVTERTVHLYCKSRYSGMNSGNAQAERC